MSAAQQIRPALTRLVERARAAERMETVAVIDAALDAYGAPPGETIDDRLRAWEQRERWLRARAGRAGDGPASP